MAQFAFNFSGDDIQDDGDTLPTMSAGSAPTTPRSARQATIPFRHTPSMPAIEISGPPREESEGRPPPEEIRVRRESVREMLATLPSRIAYTTTLLTSPQKERRALIPRRALFDVRLQIMAESGTVPASPPAQSPPSTTALGSTLSTPTKQRKKKRKDLAGKPIVDRADSEGSEIGLGDVDIEQNVYEGGFKSWEGATDLARLVLERGPRKDIDDLARVEGVVELGCGTALPTLVLFQHALTTDLSLDFTLADYNASVLRLVTLPNLLLVWAQHASPSSFSPALHLPTTPTPTDQTGDLHITPTLLTNFTTDLTARGITLTLLSGPWSPTALPPLIPTHPSMSLLLLASETIYSPSSLSAFTATLLAILRRVRLGKALVAAKRVYFGVGGSVDAFKGSVGEGGGVVAEVENSGIEGCERGFMGGGTGVGRCLLEVQMC